MDSSRFARKDGNQEISLLCCAAALAGGRQRLVHDAPDRARTAAALGGATEAMVDLAVVRGALRPPKVSPRTS